MIIYLVERKIPDYEDEPEKFAESSLVNAKKVFIEKVEELRELGEQGWVVLKMIKLTKSLSNKQLILAIMSGRGFAEKIETIDSFHAEL